MGGVNTSEKQRSYQVNQLISSDITLDWLSFTIDNTLENMEKVEKFFDNMTITKLGYGGMGYTHSSVLGDGGRILWNNERPDMGIHVKLPSRALADVETTSLGLLMRVRDWGGKVTRMDLAFDDTLGWLDIDEMYRKILAGELVTRWRKVTRIDGGNIGKNEKTGHTINLGARVSEAFLRIYDKKLEQDSKNDGALDYDFWVRVELELKGGKAQAFAEALCEAVVAGDKEPGLLCSELLYGLVDFKEPREATDGNKSRWPTVEWWSGFVGATSKMKLAKPKHEKTLDDSKQWIEKSVASTLSMIVLSENDDNGQSGYDFIVNCIRIGQYRMSKEQRMRLDLYNEGQVTKKSGCNLVDKMPK